MIITNLESLVNETILVHELFLVNFVNFICYLYIFRTSPGPLSGETSVYMRHLVLVILFNRQCGIPSCIPDNQVNRITRWSVFDFKLSSCSVCCMFFWVIPRRLNFICRRFGTLCLFHLHRHVGVEFYTYLLMKIKQSVPKRRHIKFRRQGITQKETYKNEVSYKYSYSSRWRTWSGPKHVEFINKIGEIH